MEINASIAFFFGALSFFSPCVLPLVPGYFAIFSINKNSFNVGFSYNFDISTQTPKIHKDSIKKILTF